MSLTEAMSYLDDNRRRIHEEVYLEMGRRLADAQDEMPTVYRVVFFTLDVEEGHVATQRRETLAVAVARDQEDRSAGGRSFGVRELLERGQCRVSWLERSFPQVLGNPHDILLMSMVPRREMNVDHAFGTE